MPQHNKPNRNYPPPILLLAQINTLEFSVTY
jgi:hypothetical protein